MHTILLTGATGNLGSRILAEYLRRSSNVRLILLVHGVSQAAAEQRIRTILSFWDCGPEATERIEILCGGVTEPMLGLSQETYARLATTVTHIIHCAAKVQFDRTLDDARSNILFATQNLVRLVTPDHSPRLLRRFVYISSLDVAGDLQGVLKEEFLDNRRRDFLNTYQQAKAETETYLKECFEKTAFPITIIRPSMLVGDSHTGKIIHPQSLYHIIHDLFLHPVSPMLPGKNFRIDTMPVDILAHAIYLMYDAPETNGKIYHAASGASGSMLLPDVIRDVQAIYASHTGTTYPLPHFISPLLPYLLLSIQSLVSWGPQKKKVRAQRDMIRYFFQDMTFDTTEFTSFLTAHNVRVPPLSSYLPVLCRYYFQQRPPLAVIHD